MAKVPAVSGSESIINVCVFPPSLFLPLSLYYCVHVNNVRHSNVSNNNMKLLKVGLHVALLLMDFICTCHASTQPPAPRKRGCYVRPLIVLPTFFWPETRVENNSCRLCSN